MWKKGSVGRPAQEIILFSAQVSEFSIVDEHYQFFKSHKIRVGRTRETTNRLGVALHTFPVIKEGRVYKFVVYFESTIFHFSHSGGIYFCHAYRFGR